MHRHIASFNDWDWTRGLVTSVLLACAILILSGCSISHPACQGPCVCPDKVSEVQPQWDKLEVEVASFGERRPTGITIAEDGRTFLAFPWAQDKPDFAVVELLPNGQTEPFPSVSWSTWNGDAGPSALRCFVCVQSVHADRQGNLWVLDTGNPRNRRGVIAGGPKLVKIDLEENKVVDVLYFDSTRFLDPDSYLAGLTVDTQTQTAYLIDSSDGEVYVIDLKTEAMRRVSLQKPAVSASTFSIDYAPAAALTDLAENAFAVTGLQPSRSTLAGIALSSDGQWLYYHTTGEQVCRVPTEKLRDRKLTDGIRSTSVEHVGETDSLISGIWLDKNDNLYMAAVDRDTIFVRTPGGRTDTLLADPRLDATEALTIGPDGYVYISAMQRDEFTVPCGQKVEHNGRVLKFSPDKVAQARQLRLEADDLHAEAAWYSQLAHEAEQLAEQFATQAEEQARQTQDVLGSSDTTEEAALEAALQAQEAQEAAQDELAAADELRGRSQEAREAAAFAEQLATEAEFAEVEGGAFDTPGLADVPTPSD